MIDFIFIIEYIASLLAYYSVAYVRLLRFFLLYERLTQISVYGTIKCYFIVLYCVALRCVTLRIA